MDTKEFLQENGLDWTVSKREMTYFHDLEVMKSNRMSLARDDNGTELNVVSKGFVPMQNEVMIGGVLNAAKDFGELSIHNTKIYRGGKKVWISFKIDGLARVGNESVERYITVINSHDGTAAFKFAIGNMVLSCTNQFHYFDKEAKLSMNHSHELKKVIKNLDSYFHKALSIELKMIETYQIFNSNFASKGLAEKMVSDLITNEFSLKENEELSTRMKNKKEKFLKAIDIEMDSKGHTMFGLFNGFTYATNHMMNSKDDQLLFGQRANINSNAFDYLKKELHLI